MGVAGASGRRPLRSVEQATALLRFVADLRGRPATVAEMAAGVDVGEAMCRRIALTLAAADLLRFDAEAGTFRLGPALAELAVTVDRDAQVRRLADEQLRVLASEVGYPCAVVEVQGEDEYTVVAQAGDGRPGGQLASAVGEARVPSGALLASARYAWASQEVVDGVISRLTASARPMASVINPAGLRRNLSTVRRDGFASQGAQGVQAGVAAPVFERDGEVRYLVLVDLPPVDLDGEVPRIGGRARSMAMTLTKALGGREPDVDPDEDRSGREEEQSWILKG